jgi:hypothetical protein
MDEFAHSSTLSVDLQNCAASSFNPSPGGSRRK